MLPGFQVGYQLGFVQKHGGKNKKIHSRNFSIPDPQSNAAGTARHLCHRERRITCSSGPKYRHGLLTNSCEKSLWVFVLVSQG